MTPELRALCEATDPQTLNAVIAHLRRNDAFPGINVWFAGVRFDLADALEYWANDPGRGPNNSVNSAFGPWRDSDPNARQVAAEEFRAMADQCTDPSQSALWSALAAEVLADRRNA
ncbi:hypothetical protein [Cryptosporangium phraense]|uniref:hypothetical protein n=1 Tax=Cryptosporangium phraense TaxID=2593070 RepID=UPI001478BBE8|nr:hypothetical protein [Cryptosporangium phraense]